MRRSFRLRRRARLAGRIQALIWLVGLAYLAVTGRWWPGILVLVAISTLFATVFNRRTQNDIEEDEMPATVDEKPEIIAAPPPRMEPVSPAPEVHRTEWLPLSCPKCGAPTRAAEVRWTGNASAACAYCGSNLPMNKS
jgi:hypothetical protein